MAAFKLRMAPARPRRARVFAAVTEATFDGDGALLAIAERRDRHAFASLFHYFAPRVKSYLLGRHVSSAVAEELTQDVMLTVWRRAEQFNPARGAASTWIFTVARNCLIDMTRRDRRPQPDPTDPSAAPETVLPEDELAARIEQHQLRTAIEQLPDDQRDALRRSYFSGQTLQQIAEADQLPLGTVKTRVRIALQKLRELITRGKDR